jgi:hypothetical protein
MAGPLLKHSRPADSLDFTRTPLSIRTLYGRGVKRPPADPVDRIRGEFVEMRGFSPTSAQAARLFDLSPDECERILARLVGEGFLRRSPDGRYRLPSADA